MTNREKILSEMEALDGDDLFKALGPADLANKLGTNMCDDCARKRGYRCQGDAENCPTWGEWMEWDCRAERILMPEEWD